MRSMEKKRIAWITFNAFLDTDLYVVKNLSQFYFIDWHIIRSGNDKFEYIDEIKKTNDKESLSVHLHVCGERLRMPSCAVYYMHLMDDINRTKPDLYYSSLAGAPYYIPIFKMYTNLDKTILAIHNVHVPKGGSAYIFFKLYNNYAISKFKHFQTFSESQCFELKKIAKNKDVLYSPFILKDYGKPKSIRKSDAITFLNFGNIREYKRLDVLINAAQTAYEKSSKEFRVIIAGKCDDWSKYEKIIKYPQLFDIRLGRVENEDIPDLFNECDYFVAPYQDIAQSGSSIVAVNYNKPIIASKLPAFEEYIEDGKTGYLMKPANVESLTDIMIKVLLNYDSEYLTMVNNVREVKEKQFSTDSIVRKYKEYFDEIINK